MQSGALPGLKPSYPAGSEIEQRELLPFVTAPLIYENIELLSNRLYKMGKLNMFVVSFSNLQGVYYAGQTVQGHVTIELTDTMKMRGIRLKFQGKAYVHWSESHTTGSGNNRRTETRHYSATEMYFEQEILLTGRWKNQSGEDMHLPAGRHVYPFAFQLPPQLPSSFEGAHGYVRYTVKGTIDKPWKFDHTTKRPFTVICLLDLNREPTAATPAQGNNSKQFCCLCCASGPVTATFTIDRHGYVPGEAIIIKAEVDNKSNRRMVSSSVVMNMTTIFRATTKTRSSSRKVAKLKHGEVQEGETDYWNGDQLIIPPLPPSFLVGCSIIDIRYTLELRVDPAGPGFDLVVPLEVIIGTIPLQHVLAQYPPMPPPVGRPMVMPNPKSHPMSGAYGVIDNLPPGVEPTAPAYPPEMPTNIPNMPPPSYGECVFGKVSIKDEDDSEHTRGDTNYTPVYTYYDWGHKPTAAPE